MSGQKPFDHDPETSARVLSFRRRPGAPPPPQGSAQGPDPVEDLSKYARDDEPDDFRHRTAVNIAALAFVALLCGVGYWLADTMASQRKNQDCVLSGRRNCAGVQVPAGDRF